MNEIKLKLKSILTRPLTGETRCFASEQEIDLIMDEVKGLLYDERLTARARGYELGYADAQKDNEVLIKQEINTAHTPNSHIARHK
jgi:hypothetical protein